MLNLSEFQTALKRNRFAGVILYEGPSAIYREIETFMEQWKAATKGAAVLIDQDRRNLESMGAW